MRARLSAGRQVAGRLMHDCEDGEKRDQRERAQAANRDRYDLEEPRAPSGRIEEDWVGAHGSFEIFSVRIVTISAPERCGCTRAPCVSSSATVTQPFRMTLNFRQIVAAELSRRYRRERSGNRIEDAVKLP